MLIIFLYSIGDKNMGVNNFLPFVFGLFILNIGFALSHDEDQEEKQDMLGYLWAKASIEYQVDQTKNLFSAYKSLMTTSSSIKQYKDDFNIRNFIVQARERL